MTQLVHYEAARTALAQARSIDDVKGVRDKAEAMRAYGKIAKDRGMEVDAMEIRIRAERRLGEMLLSIKADGLMNDGGRPSKITKRAGGVLLKEIGVDHKLSTKAQRFARVPEPKFEGLVNDWRSRSLEEKSRVIAEIEPPKSMDRTSVSFAIAGGDVRHWSVAKLRRIAKALTEVSEHCGQADSGDSVGDCISDARLAKICRVPH